MPELTIESRALYPECEVNSTPVPDHRMTGTRRRVTMGIALVAILAGSEAAAERPENIDTSRSDTTQFAYQFSRGQVLSNPWTFHERVEGLDGTAGGVWNVTLTMLVRNEIQTVDSAGVASVATSLSDIAGTVEMYGEDIDVAELAPVFEAARISLNVDQHGNASDRRDQVGIMPVGPDLSTDVPDMLRLLWVNYPIEPVSIGNSWLGTIPMADHDPESGLTSTVVARYTLAGFAAGESGELAVLDIDYTIEMTGSRDLSNDGTRMVQIVGRGNGQGHALV